MKVYLIILLCWLVVNTRVAAQGFPGAIKTTSHRSIDSIKNLIIHTPDDTTKILLLIKLSDAQLSCSPNNFEDAKNSALAANLLSEKLNYRYGIALSLRGIGHVYEKMKDFKNAVVYYKRALDKTDYTEYAMRENFYSPLLNTYFYLGDYSSAMGIVSNEMKIAEEIKDKRAIADCNNLFGFIFFNEENYEEAEKYYQLYISHAEELKDSVLLIHALGETADLYIQQKQLQKSLSVLNEALNICNILIVGTNPRKNYVAQLRNKLMYRFSKVYQLSNNSAEALRYALITVNFSKTNPINLYDGAEYYINTGRIYKQTREYKNAIKYLHYGFNLANEINHEEDIKEAAEQLAQTYALEKKYDSAFFFYRLYTSIRDSIDNSRVKMQIAEIQSKYDVAKKNEEIIRQQRLKNLITGSSVSLILFLLIFYYANNLKQKNKLQQEKYIQQQELFNAIITTQDNERKRIAQDIHDRVGSVLSAAKINLSTFENEKMSQSEEHFAKYKITKDLLDEASAELRSIAHNLMPATLSKLGLVAAIKNLVGNVTAHSNLQINFSTYGLDKRFDETTEINVYQIVLELISNIVKHAQANYVTIQLIQYDDHLNIMVEDNGCGFDYHKQMKERKGIGLANIYSRVEFLKGIIDIDSKEKEGTTISIHIPYLQEI